MFCPVCSQILPVTTSKICNTCRAHLEHLSYKGLVDISGLKVHVGFRYRSTIRAMLLRAKVKNEVPALAALIFILKHVLGNQLRTFNDPACLVIPAPSSLWSRVTGRFDVARVMSVTMFPLAANLDGPLPGSFWRRKRAGRNVEIGQKSSQQVTGAIHDFFKKTMNYQVEFNECIDLQRKVSSASRILVIDDVLTTGLTMGTLFHQLKTLGAHRIEGLILAAVEQVFEQREIAQPIG